MSIIRNVNKALRILVLTFGGIIAIVKLIEHREKRTKVDKQSFEAEEFDDIW